MFRRGWLLLLLATTLNISLIARAEDGDRDDHGRHIRHVLLISIDGMHSLDFVNCANGVEAVNNGASYCPTLASLSNHGIDYLNASTSRPSDSFPGLTAIVSGASPRTAGAYYDVAYDRVLAPPINTTGNGVAGGTCLPNQPNGTRTEYEEGIDKDQTRIDGGGDSGFNSIDATRLPRDPFNNCKPVYPWEFVRTNSVFGVIHQAGGFAAWSDKHPAYTSVAGRGGAGNLDDFYGPEINSNVLNNTLNVTTPEGMNCNPIPDPNLKASSQYTDSFQAIQCYDTVKVNAILNEINGKSLRGAPNFPVPTIFGMNFQAVSVGQKLIEKGVGTGGYTDAAGTPTSLMLGEIKFVDDSIGEMVSALKKNHLLDSTLIVITAKHGQSPIDTNRYFGIPGVSGNNGNSPVTILDNLNMGLIPFSESTLNPNGIGPTEDDVSLIWLADSSKTDYAVSVLEQPANATAEGLGEIFHGPSLTTMFNAPGIPPNGDSRTPDIIVTPNYGVVYTGSSKKQAEHGGFSHDDTNVMMLLSNPSFHPKTVNVEVQTSQVAPTILKALGLDPNRLDGVRIEGTSVLPAVQFGGDGN